MTCIRQSGRLIQRLLLVIYDRQDTSHNVYYVLCSTGLCVLGYGGRPQHKGSDLLMSNYLPPPFEGWRIAGNYLVAPDGQRITRGRLEGIMWRDAQELRLAGFVSRRKAENGKRRFGNGTVKVLVVPVIDWFERRFGKVG